MEKKLTSEDLAAAVRWLDNKTLEQGGHEVLASGLGITWDELAYMASQRALRIILLMLRGEKPVTKMAECQLDPLESMIEKLLMAASVEGIAIGIAASQGRSAPPPSKTSEN